MPTQLVAQTVAEALADLATNSELEHGGATPEIAGPQEESVVETARLLVSRRGDDLRIEAVSDPAGRGHQRRLPDGLSAEPYFASYAASKAFVLSFSEALAEELRGTGVRVTAVAPGFVSTEFSEVAGSSEPERRFPHLQPRRIVESALRAHERGRAVKVVGPFYAFLSFAGRFAPRAALRRMMGRALRPSPAPRARSPAVPPT
jgi:NAD(P)-dependent dehydrogenase (short-subunit alcohol dehydrogenase family)